jgi:hypothetical protein
MNDRNLFSPTIRAARCAALPALALALLCAARPAAAQWEIFAEAPPAPGSWAKFDLERKKMNGNVEHSEVTISVTGAEKRDGADLVWLEISPTKWLGSKKKGAVKFLIPAAMSRAQASHLLTNAKEIIFQEPGKTPYYMTPNDVASLSGVAGYYQSAQVTPSGDEKVVLALGEFKCRRSKLTGEIIFDPPFVAKQVATLDGTVLFEDKVPFRVIRMNWQETTVKKEDKDVEQKSMTLVAHGATGAKTQAPERGEKFSISRILFRR